MKGECRVEACGAVGKNVFSQSVAVSEFLLDPVGEGEAVALGFEGVGGAIGFCPDQPIDSFAVVVAVDRPVDHEPIAGESAVVEEFFTAVVFPGTFKAGEVEVFGFGNGWGAVAESVVLEDDDPGGDLNRVAVHPVLVFGGGAGFVEFILQFPAPAVGNVPKGEQVAEFCGVDREFGGDGIVLGGDACDVGGRSLDALGSLVWNPGEVGEVFDPVGKDFCAEAGFVGEEADPGIVQSAGLLLLKFLQECAPESCLPCQQLVAVGGGDPCAGQHSAEPFEFADEDDLSALGCALSGGLDSGGCAAGGAADDENVCGEGLHGGGRSIVRLGDVRNILL